MTWDLLDRIRSLAPGCAVFNHYGPTEATVGVAAFRADREGARESATVPLGRPLAGRLYVLGSGLEPMPPGLPGELFIGGSNLARGYLGRPDLTAWRFLPDPFGEAPGGRLYRTGDLSSLRPGGELEFLGRIDEQVKVRGFRVEPGEVAAALAGHPGVEQAFVLARRDGPAPSSSVRLAAYFTAVSGAEPDAEELRAFLRRALPEPMVPSAFVLLEALPRTRNGKIDLAALPAPEEVRPEEGVGLGAPRTGAEEVLRTIWREVLGHDEIGVHDNFFELGGDSILSIQIIARANQAGLRLTPRQIFQHQTIAGLAAVAGTAPAVRSEQGAVTGPVPLLPIQRRFFELESPEPWHWNMALLLKVSPSLDRDLLPAVLGHLLAHHDALRLRFRREGGVWRQHNAAPGADVPYCVVDLTGIPSERRGRPGRRGCRRRSAAWTWSADRWCAWWFRPWGRAEPAADRGPSHGHGRRVVADPDGRPGDGLGAARPRRDSAAAGQDHLLQALGGTAGRPCPVARDPGRARALGDGPQEGDTPAQGPRGWGQHVASGRILSVELSEEETRELLQEVPKAYNTQIEDTLLTALARAFGAWTGEAALLVEMEGHGREDLPRRRLGADRRAGSPRCIPWGSI